MNENEISKIVVDAGLKVHRTLGPGLLESAYEACLYHELCSRHLQVEKQKPIPLVYQGVQLEVGYRIDLLVENKLVVEIIAVDALHVIHRAQILNYLRLSNCKLGLLINFNTVLFKEGVKRFIIGKI